MIMETMPTWGQAVVLISLTGLCLSATILFLAMAVAIVRDRY